MLFRDLMWALIKTGKIYDLTRDELEELTGYSRSTVQRWFKKKPQITLQQYIDWANALGYEVTITRRKNDPTSTDPAGQ